MKILILLISGGLAVGCGTQEFNLKQDFRKDSVYQNTELVFDKAKGESKGTILLIHGTAPQNIDGQIAIPEAHNALKKKDPRHYIIQPTYKELAEYLNDFGWNTVRYTRVGVYQHEVNLNEYGKTDLNNVMDQLRAIWAMIPNDKPRIAFAWSGGSIHVLQLPLKTFDAAIILGGIVTKRLDVFRLRAKNTEEQKTIEKWITDTLVKEEKVSRTQMLGNDMPYGRFFDENNIKNNWEYLSPYKKLPVLILHGEVDEEVDVSQAKLWKEKLPGHNIDVYIKKSGNHAFGTKGNQPDMHDLAKTINTWLDKKL